MDTIRTCRHCGREFSQPYRPYHTGSYRKYCCPEHARDARNARHNAHNRGVVLGKYGITESDYARLLEAQGGRCAICGTDSPPPGKAGSTHLCVDHDHGTGKIRGLLCRHCNSALGLFGDDTVILARAIGYLAPSDRRAA